MATFFHQIRDAADELLQLKHDYLRRWGWSLTCNTPGAYWLWKRDFAVEDQARHQRWKDAGPGPLGWPSEPQPYGVITADLDLAINITVRDLDEQPELPEGDED